MEWFITLLPIIGFLIGISACEDFFLSPKLAIKIFLCATSLIIFHLLSDISFSANFMDWLVISITLFLMGFIGGRKKGPIDKLFTVRLLFKTLTIAFYLLIPVYILTTWFLAFRGDFLGQTVEIEKRGNYKIQHICKNSNFTFSGIHIAKIYKQVLIIELPVDEFNLGQYGNYGLNSYEILRNGESINNFRFEYEPKKQKLIVYTRDEGKYVKIKEFKNNKRQ